MQQERIEGADLDLLESLEGLGLLFTQDVTDVHGRRGLESAAFSLQGGRSQLEV